MKLSMLDQHRSDNFTYCDSSLLTDIMKQFSICRTSNRFIDLEVEVKGVVFPCHQILMDALCPYFSAHFSFNEQKTEVEEGLRRIERVSLKYDGITVKGFSNLLDFMYSGELQVTTDNVIDILFCADFLQLDKVVNMCATFLLQHIATETCLHVLVLAQAHGLSELAEKALSFVLSHLKEVICLEEFTHLSKEVLVSIISHRCLEVKTEVTIVEAILTWVQGRNEPQPFLRELLQHAHLLHSDIEELKQDKLFMEKIREMELLEEQIIKDSKNAAKDKECVQDFIMNYLIESAVPFRLREELVVVCENTDSLDRKDQDMKTVYCYNAGTQKWVERTDVPFADREGYAVAVFNNKIHVTGGQQIRPNPNTRDFKKFIFGCHVVYDPQEDKWHRLAAMRTPRYNHSSAALKNKLYVVGGQQSSVDLTSLYACGEVYDPNTGMWTYISPVRGLSGIANAALASVNGKLYIMGGFYCHPDPRREIPFEYYFGAQVYDPEEDLWSELLMLEQELTQKNLHLSKGCVLAAEGLLILLDDKVGKWHNVYNPVSQKLQPLMQAHGHHQLCGWALYQGQLVCAGGVRNCMVHQWDLTGRTTGWHMMPSMPVSMSSHTCLTLHFPQLEPVMPEQQLSDGSSDQKL